MRNLRTVLGAGTAAIAAIGFCGVAAAQSPQTHVMNLTLPDGGVAQIHYVGNTPPQVYISDSPAPVLSALPSVFGRGSPFAEMERISAAMDRQADQMFRQAAALMANPAQLSPTEIGTLPAGAQEYQFVSMMNGNGVCSRSVEITSQGNGTAPRVVTHTSGNCNTAAAPGFQPEFQVPTQLPTAPAPSSGPKMIMTKATGAQPYGGRIEQASLN
jgi:hypothetical protein